MTADHKDRSLLVAARQVTTGSSVGRAIITVEGDTAVPKLRRANARAHRLGRVVIDSCDSGSGECGSTRMLGRADWPASAPPRGLRLGWQDHGGDHWLAPVPGTNTAFAAATTRRFRVHTQGRFRAPARCAEAHGRAMLVVWKRPRRDRPSRRRPTDSGEERR